MKEHTINIFIIAAHNESEEAILHNLWNGQQETIQLIGFNIRAFTTKPDQGSQVILEWQMPPSSSLPTCDRQTIGQLCLTSRGGAGG
jgi:hypothetical protein